MSEPRLPALIFDCDGVLVDSEYLASRVESELTRELGLDARASRRRTTCSSARPSTACSTRSPRVPAQRPSSALGLQLGVRHRARLHARAARPSTAWARRWRRCAAAVIAWRWRRSRRWRACGCRCRSPGWPASSASTSTSPRWCRGPSRRRTSIYWPRSGSARRRADCIVIEDSPAGAAAARAAGMRALGYAPGRDADAMRASGAQVIRSMDDLIAAIGA